MARFDLFLPLVQQAEGGFQKLAGDPGNYNSLGQLVGTNHGISARFYEDVIRRPPTEADMRAITKAKAASLFKTYFWDDVHGDLIANQSVANVIADHNINAGEKPIAEMVQRILRNDFRMNVTIDGDIGPKTAAAINAVNQQQLFDRIKAAREAWYRAKGGEFLNSWLSRLRLFVFTEKKK